MNLKINKITHEKNGPIYIDYKALIIICVTASEKRNLNEQTLYFSSKMRLMFFIQITDFKRKYTFNEFHH